MKNAKMLTILILAMMFCPASTALGTVSLSVNGQDVTSIELELGKSCTVEVVSDDSAPYMVYLGFDDAVVLGDFLHLETKPEAGDMATVIEYEQPTFYGYYLRAFGFNPMPSAGIHFNFEYVALQLGETVLKLYNDTFTSVIDYVNITVIPLQPVAMGSAFTYQGSLNDAGSPADGLYDFQLKLFDDPNTETANQIGATIDIDDLDVIDGFFTIVLDFGTGVFTGDARWLEMTVAQSDGSESFTLTPPLELTPTPYAIYAENAGADNDWMLSGDDMYSIPSGNVGIGTSAPDAKLDVVVASGPAATIGSCTNSAAGDFAVAMGSGTTATGDNSTAMGHYTTAGGNYSTAMGHGTIASGGLSTAMGWLTIASGYNSTAVGRETTASGYNSTAMGREIEAAGMYSVAIALADMDGATVTQDNAMAIMGGNVGIGTPSPAEKLAVSLGSGSGDIASFSAFNTNRFMISIDGVDTSLSAQSGNNLKLGTSFSGPSVTILNSTGNVGIGTPSPAEKLEVDGTVQATAFLGDGSGLTNLSIGSDSDWTIADSNMYSAVSGNVGIGTIAPGAKLDVEVTSGPAATIGNSGNYAAGDYAVAMGADTTAYGDYSTAMGSFTTAGGDSSTAMGYGTTAGGYCSVAMGSSTTAGGSCSTAMGNNTTASGYYSTAMGAGTTAYGYYSTAMGSTTTARGYYSTAMGYGTTAGGYRSTAMGSSTTASGDYSTAMGSAIDVAGIRSVAIGLDDTYRIVTQNNTMAIMGGNVGINKLDPSRRFFVNGDAGGTTGWYNDSDSRLKKDIATIDNALEKVNKLRGVEFEWKDTVNHAEGRQIGFIGQEAVEVVPQVVDVKNGHYSMQYAPLTALLVEAVKELQSKNDELQEQNNQLESRLSALENAIRNGSVIGKEL